MKITPARTTLALAGLAIASLALTGEPDSAPKATASTAEPRSADAVRPAVPPPVEAHRLAEDLFDAPAPSLVPAVPSPDGSWEYAAGEVLVRPDPDEDPRAVAARLADAGARWIKRGTRSGLWRVGFERNAPLPDLLAAAAVDGVRGIRPNAVARGAARGGIAGGGGGGGGGGGTTTYEATSATVEAEIVIPPDSLLGLGCGPADLVPYQWSRTHAETPAICPSTSSAPPVVIAVIDSGVAYTDAVEHGHTHLAAPELAGVPIVDPYDFVDDDALPLDDHQHGTHIAGIIASRDRLRGHFSNPVLMPIRVLDANNAGTEFEVIEGITWAVDRGAQVANLSLSFGLGYLPSQALADAVQHADEEGVVLVSAAGNDGNGMVAYPAAFPSVIAVGSVMPTDKGGLQKSDYGNEGFSLLVTSAGGSVLQDADGDGVVDGVVAQTLTPGQPDQLGYWAIAGTSQASAVVASQAAGLIAQGVEPAAVRRELVLAADQPGNTRRTVTVQTGAGVPLGSLLDAAGPATAPIPVYVNAVASFIQLSGATHLQIRVEAVDADGVPLPTGTVVYGSWRGSVSGSGMANLDGNGQNSITSHPIPAGPNDPLFLSWTIDGVVRSDDPDEAYTLAGSFYRLPEGTGHALEEVFDEPTGDSGVVFHIDPDEPTSCDLWDCSVVQSSYFMPSWGSGFSSSTLNFSFNDAFLSLALGSGFSSSTLNLSLGGSYLFPWGSSSSAEYEVLAADGTGFSSSTLNVLTWDRFSFAEGSGFSSSTLSLSSSLSLAWGSGFSSSTLVMTSFGGSYLDDPALDGGGAWSALGSGFSSSTLNTFTFGDWALGSGLQVELAPLATAATAPNSAVLLPF